MYYYQLLLYITVILVIIIVIIVITTIEWYWMTTMDILSFHVIFAPCVLLYTFMHVAAWCCMYSIHVRNELRVVLCEGPARARTPWKMDKLEGTAERTHRSVWFSVGLCQGYVTSLFWAVGTFKAGPASGWAKWTTLESLGITRHVLKCFQHISTYQWYSCCVSQWYLVISNSPVLMQNPTSPSCQVRCRWFSSYQRLWKDPSMCHLNCIWIIWHIWHFHVFSVKFRIGSNATWCVLQIPADSCRVEFSSRLWWWPTFASRPTWCQICPLCWRGQMLVFIRWDSWHENFIYESQFDSMRGCN